MWAERLEKTQWDFFWIPQDVVICDKPELAYLTCKRPELYLNTAYRIRPDETPIDQLIAEVADAHRGPSRFQLADTTELIAIESGLAGAGYELGDNHIASIIEVDRFEPRASGDIRVERVTNREQLRDGLAVMDAAFAMTVEVSDELLDHMLSICIGDGARIWRFVAYDGHDEPVSYGGLNHFPDLSLGQFWGGGTIPSARGKGAYSAVVAARVDAARAAGLDAVGLYAKTDTSAPIVARQGFVDVGRMNHWVRPPTA